MSAYKTKGEILREFILEELIAGREWSNLGRLLSPTGRSNQLIEFFQEITAVSTVGRLVRAGIDIAEELETSSPEFIHDYSQFVRETFSASKSISDELLRLAVEAVKAARKDATTKQRQGFRKAAQSKSESCYLCGVKLVFEDDANHAAYSLDHVWPRSYGGDSESENFIACCRECNNSKKQNYANWAMPSIQAILYPLNATSEQLGQMNGSHRFAIHHMAAHRVAQQRGISLKRAFQSIGPWKTLTTIDNSVVADFFNITASQ